VSVERSVETTTSDSQPLAFGPFVLDRAKRVLLRDGRPVALTSKTLDVLLALVERRDRVVSKDELLQAAWGDRIVEENNLFRQISRLRKALDERPDEHRYIVTLPNEGYRFVGDVVEKPGPVQGSKAGVEDERQQGRPRFFAIATGIAGVTLVALFALLGRPIATASDEALASPTLKQLTFEEGFPRQPAWSPTGQAFVYVSDQNGNPDLWVKTLADGGVVQLTRTPWSESSPSWSPDGRRIAYRSTRDGGGLYVADADGSGERRLAEFGYSPQWSPDGASVLFTMRPGGASIGPFSVYVVGLDGRPPRLVRPDVTRIIEPAGAAWHPDGRVSVLGRAEQKLVLITADLAGGAAVTAFSDASFQESINKQSVVFGRFRWAPEGDAIYLEGTSAGVANIWRVSIDPATGQAITSPARVTVGPGADVSLSVGPDGRVLYASRASRSRLWAYGFDAVAGRVLDAGVPLTSGVPGEVSADASPDGKMIAYTVLRGDQQEVWIRPLDRGADTLLFTGRGGTFSKARWSSDGRHVVLSRRWTPVEAHAKVELIQISTATKAVQVVPLNNLTYFVPNDSASDSRTVLGACQQSAGEPIKVCAVSFSSDASTVEVAVLAVDPVRELRNVHFSPDERWIVFQALDRRPQGTSSLFVMPASGGAWITISSDDSFDDKPRWAPDGRTIFYVSDRDGGARNVWARRFNPAGGVPQGAPFQVTSFNSDVKVISGDARNMDIALTRSRVLLPITESAGQIWMLEPQRAE
jgi:Tol biopolymer transport system component/DNA-binding winged helix-turn-helix (wHTH) protein